MEKKKKKKKKKVLLDGIRLVLVCKTFWAVAVSFLDSRDNVTVSFWSSS
jgi:hypothetical protein